MRQTALAAALCLALLPGRAAAWGERGHHAVARAAALRVLEGVEAGSWTPEGKSLLAFFRSKAIQLGHLANIPDTYWRGLDKVRSAENAPTHFADADHWTEDFDAIPLDYGAALAKFQGKPSLIDGSPVDLFETGTLYWRAQQFYGLLIDAFRRAKTAPENGERKAAVKDALLYAGLMAHFIGDASMPYHNAADYDGFTAGNGGIHSYFETEALSSETPELEAAVFRRIPEAFRNFGVEAKFQQGGRWSGALLSRELGRQAFRRIPELRRLDDAFILERSTVTDGGKRLAASRKPAEEAMEAFRPMIEEQLAFSAAVLARLWRGAWEQAGRPDLSKVHFWDYHHSPHFIPPDYDPDALRRIKERLKTKS